MSNSVVHGVFRGGKRKTPVRITQKVGKLAVNNPTIASENSISHKIYKGFNLPGDGSPPVATVFDPDFRSEGPPDAKFGVLGPGGVPHPSLPIPPVTPGELLLAKKLPHDTNPPTVYLASLGRGSRRTMGQALEVIASLLTGGSAGPLQVAWHLVRFQHSVAVRAALAEKYSIASTNKMLAALRGTLRTAWRLGLMDAEHFHRAIDMPSVRGEALPRGRALSSGELLALFDGCDDSTKAGTRDAAVLAVSYACGLRRSEVVALEVADFNKGTGELTIRKAKGGKDRTVYATGGALDAMRDWLAIRGESPGTIFVPINKGDRLSIRPMTDQAVLNLCRKRAREAGVKVFSPHDLRRSFVSHLLDKSADLSTVRSLAGHSSVQTTARYDRRGEQAKKTASTLLHVPYRGKTPVAPDPIN